MDQSYNQISHQTPGRNSAQRRIDAGLDLPIVERPHQEETKSERKATVGKALYFNKSIEAASMQSDRSTAFSGGCSEFGENSPKSNGQLPLILEKGESRYDTLGDFQDQEQPEMMTEDRCEQLLEKLENQSFALRQRADRLQMLSTMAAQTS